MHDGRKARALILGSALSVAVAVAACTRENASTTGARGTSGEDRSAAVTLTGCLQKGTGMLMDTYILTQASRTSGTVGTSGSSVGDKQLDAAMHSYRLDGDSTQLGDLVGKQVRVNGHITDRGDLDKTERERSASSDKRDIEQGDLPKVKVDSVDKVAEACGAAYK